MPAQSIIIRFVDAAVQPEHPPKDGSCIVRRIVGTVQMKQLLPLYHDTILGPDPRSARRNRVIDDILRSLTECRDTGIDFFANRSKGILLGTGNFKSLDRNRYRVEFEDPEVEGVLDGGHNLLGAGLFMLKDLMDERDWKQVKSWDDLLKVWPKYAEQLDGRKEEFDTLIPLELLVPARSDEEAVDAFRSALIDICAAQQQRPASVRSSCE